MTTDDLLLQLALFAAVGLAIGFLSGLFGIGGGIVRIPVFIYLLPRVGVEHETLMHVAIGTSVSLIVPTAIMATYKQVRLGNLDMNYYAGWAVGVLIGVVAGMILLPYASTEALKAIFIVYLFSVGCYVGLVKDTRVVSTQLPAGPVKLAVSAVVGMAAALTGTGGGALVTPILKAFSCPLHRAIAMASASGLVIGVASTVAVIFQGWNAPGLPAHSLGYIDLPVFAAMLPTTLLGTPLGVRVGNRLNKQWLKRIYTALLFIAAADMAYKTFT